MSAQDPHLNLSSAMDLSALKGMSDQQRSRLREMSMQLFVNNGLICQCGNKIESDGIQFFLYREGILPTQRGPEPGVQLLTSNFCSRECSEFKDAMNISGREEGFIPVAIRNLTPNEWLDECEFLTPKGDDKEVVSEQTP